MSENLCLVRKGREADPTSKMSADDIARKHSAPPARRDWFSEWFQDSLTLNRNQRGTRLNSEPSIELQDQVGAQPHQQQDSAVRKPRIEAVTEPQPEPIPSRPINPVPGLVISRHNAYNPVRAVR